MPRRPAAYPAVYCEQTIALACAGRGPKELVREFEPSSKLFGAGCLFKARIVESEPTRLPQRSGPTATPPPRISPAESRARHLGNGGGYVRTGVWNNPPESSSS